MKKALFNLLKVVIAVGLIYWLLSRGKIDFAAIKTSLNFKTTVFCLLAVFFGYVTTSLRWKILLAAQNIKISFFDTLQLTLMSSFFNFILPGGVSGDAVKAYFISKSQTQKSIEQKWRAGVSVLIDRYIGLSALCIIAYIVILFDWSYLRSNQKLMSVFYFLSLVMVLLAFIGLAIFSKKGFQRVGALFRQLDIKFGDHAKNFFNALSLNSSKPLFLIQCFGLSFIGHITVILVFCYLGSQMAPNIPFHVYFYCAPIALMLSNIPLAPGGIGVGQAAFYFIFNLYIGESSELGPTLATIYQMLNFAFSILGSLFYFRIREKVRQASVV